MWRAVQMLKDEPTNEDARGMILYGASISTSSRLGLGKEKNYAYDIYEVEFVPEVLLGVSYRKSLTTIFPRILKAMGKYHVQDIEKFFRDAFDFEGSIEGSAERMIEMFADMGVDMYFEKGADVNNLKGIPIETTLAAEEVAAIMQDCLKKQMRCDRSLSFYSYVQSFRPCMSWI